MTPNNRKADFGNNLDWANDFSNSNNDLFHRNDLSGSNYNSYNREDINHLLNNISPGDES